MGKAVYKLVAEDDKIGALKYILSAILIAAGSGPLLCVTIQQVCVSKCLLLQRLPKLGAQLDDILLITLFVFYVFVNYATCCITWSLFRKGLRRLYLRWLACQSNCVSKPKGFVARWILMDPKITRSGGVYGYRKARYVQSETSDEGK